MFYNKERNLNRRNALMDALQSSRLDTRNNITPFQPVQPRQSAGGESVFGGASGLLDGAGSLYKGLQESGLLNNNSNALSNSGLYSDMKFDSPIGSAINSEVLGTTSSASPISSAISSEAPMLGSASGFNGAPLIGNAIGGLQGFGKTGDWKGGVQGMFGVDSGNDNDVMQGIKGTLNGGMTGFSVGGPIGAAIGAALGLGSSFIDDF